MSELKNVVSLCAQRNGDISAKLRELADEIEKGTIGATRVLCVIDDRADSRISTVFAGQEIDGPDLVGVLEWAKMFEYMNMRSP